MVEISSLNPTFHSVAQFKACPAQLSMQLAAQDKEAMVRALQSRRTAGSKGQLPTTSGSFPEGDHISPQLRLSPEDGPGWYMFDRPMLYVFAGQGPYVGRWVDLLCSS
jgi:sphingosine kinase